MGPTSGLFHGLTGTKGMGISPRKSYDIFRLTCGRYICEVNGSIHGYKKHNKMMMISTTIIVSNIYKYININIYVSR